MKRIWIPTSNEPESARYETIEPQKDNPIKKEFEIGQLSNEELKEDELRKDERAHGTPGNQKHSQRKFYYTKI